VNVPEVKSIKVTIPGEQLDSNGYYACNTAGTDGITLHHFRAGTYSYTIDALDASGNVIYKGSGSFTVNGNVLETVDLTPNGNPFAYVSWSFPGNPTCAQANVTSMKISLDNGPWENVDCAAGMVDGGLASPDLTPGNHTIRIAAYGRDKWGRDGLLLYNTLGTMTLPRSGSIAASFQLFAVGGMSLKWKFWDGYASKFKDCAEAGVDRVVIHLFDLSANRYVFGEAGESVACTLAPVIYSDMKPGQYKVYMYGMSGSAKLYSSESTPETVTVEAFDQKIPTDPGTPVTLVRL
jgi:hypothetical protein